MIVESTSNILIGEWGELCEGDVTLGLLESLLKHYGSVQWLTATALSQDSLLKESL